MDKPYELARVAVDAAILTIHNRKLHVLLYKREKEPFKGKLELPGGLLLNDETAEETLKRKLKETIGPGNIFFSQFCTFTKPSRDPRGRTISIGFIALINKERIRDMEHWHDCSALSGLAFDHKEIISMAESYLKENISSIIIKQFMPKEFPLNKLQDVYEEIEGKQYDNRNFRKKVLNSGLVVETRNIEKDVSHRPAKLFRFK
ncbi:MAG: NUDIX domain-containing protein [Candidatus Woesearchaeota archaeon]